MRVQAGVVGFAADLVQPRDDAGRPVVAGQVVGGGVNAGRAGVARCAGALGGCDQGAYSGGAVGTRHNARDLRRV